jgi:hypothetical protein
VHDKSLGWSGILVSSLVTSVGKITGKGVLELHTIWRLIKGYALSYLGVFVVGILIPRNECRSIVHTLH